MNNPKANSKQKQLQMKKRRQIQLKKLRKKKRAEARKLFFNRLLMFFLIFIVMLGVSVGLFFINLFIHNDVKSLDYTYQIGTDTDPGRIRKYVNYNTLYIDGKMYINMTELASVYGFITTGGTDSIRFLFLDVNEEITDDVKFFLDSSFAYVNGVKIRLASPVYKRNSIIYVPLTFFQSYVTGIKIEYDEYNKKLVISNSASESNAVTLKLHLDESTENIPESSLDYLTLYLTDPERIREAEANANAESESGVIE